MDSGASKTHELLLANPRKRGDKAREKMHCRWSRREDRFSCSNESSVYMLLNVGCSFPFFVYNVKRALSEKILREVEAEMHIFQYHPDILTRYPQIVGGAILARNVTNGPTPARLQALYQAEQQRVLQRIGSTPLSQIESLSASRRRLTGFGVDPTQYRSASEALLRRLTKKGDIPSLNLLVDLGNLVSIRYGLPVAVFDTHALTGKITVRLADGSERFTPLGEPGVEHPEPGEVIFADPTGLVIARRWCWRQSDDSAA